MFDVYLKTNLEHSLDKEIEKEVTVSAVASTELEIPVAHVYGCGNLKSVAKHYIEEEKQVFILLECTKFDSSLQVAKDLGCGVIFECGTKFENALKTSPIEIERLAGLNDIAQNVKRVAAIYANSVPFSMSSKQAESEINKTIIDQDQAVEAIEILGSTLQKNRVKAASKNVISPRQNVKVREFGFHKFSEEGLEALRAEMRAA